MSRRSAALEVDGTLAVPYFGLEVIMPQIMACTSIITLERREPAEGRGVTSCWSIYS